MIRSWLFKMVYPLPQKKEDFFACKEKFITEYISFYQALAILKDLFVSKTVLNDVCYAKSRHDKEQKRRLEAYKTWCSIVGKKIRS